jgi:hypothetical protein
MRQVYNWLYLAGLIAILCINFSSQEPDQNLASGIIVWLIACPSGFKVFGFFTDSSKCFILRYLGDSVFFHTFLGYFINIKSCLNIVILFYILQLLAFCIDHRIKHCQIFTKKNKGENILFSWSTLKYPIKEHAHLLIFNILPPLLAFFHPACLLIFKIFPPCSFIPSLPDYFFFVKKYLHPVLLPFVYSFLTYTWLQMQTNLTKSYNLHNFTLNFIYFS